jgi:hypothetical protein
MILKTIKRSFTRITLDTDEEAIAAASYLDGIAPGRFELDAPHITLFAETLTNLVRAFHAGYWAGEKNGYAAGLDQSREATET